MRAREAPRPSSPKRSLRTPDLVSPRGGRSEIAASVMEFGVRSLATALTISVKATTRGLANANE